MKHLKAISLALILLFQLSHFAECRSSSSDEDESSGNKDDEGYFDGRKRPHCEGRGDKYCYKFWKKSCPSECEDICDESDDDDSDDIYDDVRPALRNAIKDSLFDQVFIDGDEFCVSNCKSHGGECHDWTKKYGEKWCKGIKCNKDIDGCHERKDFSDLNCGICKRLFPDC
ncbi:hypothetical protein TVWG_00023 [Tetraselmis viridis virus N1]|uniref:Uncharacterized protein n=1 Tax=Tetraselmis viridis virus S1 TaxID=756285 RepID=M4QPL9_9VIRU|nr:hypothetical protein TVSG_00003 [Tetraselmis viridis virus S1]AET84788.1 hypothetical protein TVWG_00023 [Tetraselmis viridis virus N1]AGH30803.1 hypothetical protein TVSG_00003 [Tetraselmis viridis virus S1]